METATGALCFSTTLHISLSVGSTPSRRHRAVCCVSFPKSCPFLLLFCNIGCSNPPPKDIFGRDDNSMLISLYHLGYRTVVILYTWKERENNICLMMIHSSLTPLYMPDSPHARTHARTHAVWCTIVCNGVFNAAWDSVGTGYRYVY